MKPGTFGNAPAANKLAELIGEMPWDDRGGVQRLVTSTLHHFARGLKAIDKIEDLPIRKTLLILWRNQVRDTLANTRSDRLQKYPLVISHARNVVTGMVSQRLRDLDA